MRPIKIDGLTDAEYDNRAAFADTAQAFYAETKRRSLEFCGRHEVRRDFSYGPEPRQRIDLVPGDPDAPTLFHIHGGYWQWNDKEDFTFVGEALHALGLNVAIVEHTLAPAATMDEIVGEIRSGLAWLRENLRDQGIRNPDIVVSGHSSGGHLCSRMKGEPGVIGIVPVSGIFDLRPIGRVYVNDVVGMNDDQIHLHSPLLHPAATEGFAFVAYGAGELQSFRDQSEAFHEHLAEAGSESVCIPCEGRNHFDVLFELSDQEGAIYQAVASRLGLA